MDSFATLLARHLRSGVAVRAKPYSGTFQDACQPRDWLRKHGKYSYFLPLPQSPLTAPNRLLWLRLQILRRPSHLPPLVLSQLPRARLRAILRA